MRRLGCALALFFRVVTVAAAHPHVFVDAAFELEFSGGIPDSIRVRWRFDDFFSRMILVDFAGTATGPLSEAQIEQLRVGAFENLSHYGFFTAILIDDEELEITSTRNFSAAVDQRALVYTFTIPLAQPGGPSEGRIAESRQVVIGTYDESFYTYLDFAVEPIMYTGNYPSGVRYELKERPEHTYYFDLIVPEMLHIRWD